MKAFSDSMGGWETEVTLISIRRTLAEGEQLVQTVNLKARSIYLVTTEGWVDVDALIIQMVHEDGTPLVPFLHEETLYFRPKRTGAHELRIVLAATAPGVRAGEVVVTVRHVTAESLSREELRKAG